MLSLQLLTKHWELPASLIGAGLALFFFYKIYRAKKFHLKELKALGLYQQDITEIWDAKKGVREKRLRSRISLKWQKNKLIFSRYNRAFSRSDFERLKENLETLFLGTIDLITVEKRWFSSQPKIILHFEAFPKNYEITQAPITRLYDLFLGITGLAKHLVLQAKDRFENTLLVLGFKGSGKTNLIISIAILFFQALIRSKRIDEWSLIVIDNKGTDYLHLIKQFNGKYFQPFRIESLREAVAELEQYKQEIENTLAEMRDRQISVVHWDDAQKLIALPKKRFIIFDEFFQYWSSDRSKPKVGKDASEEEREPLEKYELQNKLGQLINFFAAQCRNTGCILIGGSQSANRTMYDYPDWTNFPDLVLGRQNQQVSIQLIGDGSLNDPSLTMGKFVLKSSAGATRFKAPLAIKQKEKGGG